MHHLTPRVPPICRKDHPGNERSASHFQLFPLTMGDRRWARAGRAVPPFGAACRRHKENVGATQSWEYGAHVGAAYG